LQSFLPGRGEESLYKEEYEISGFNPVLGEETKSLRRRVIQDWEIPNFKSEEDMAFLQKIINRN
jgi:hypothetical protein